MAASYEEEYVELLMRIAEALEQQNRMNERFHDDHVKQHADSLAESNRIHDHIIDRDAELSVRAAEHDAKDDAIHSLRRENETLSNSLLKAQHELVELQRKNLTLANEREEHDKKLREKWKLEP